MSSFKIKIFAVISHKRFHKMSQSTILFEELEFSKYFKIQFWKQHFGFSYSLLAINNYPKQH
jgi:hypothetical protein